MASGNTSSQTDNIVGINIDGDPVTDISFAFEGRGFEGVNASGGPGEKSAV
jgi:hypothetical protein